MQILNSIPYANSLNRRNNSQFGWNIPFGRLLNEMDAGHFYVP